MNQESILKKNNSLFGKTLFFMIALSSHSFLGVRAATVLHGAGAPRDGQGEAAGEAQGASQNALGLRCEEGVFKNRPEAFAPFAQYSQIYCGAMTDAAEKEKCVQRIAKLAGITEKESSGDQFNVTTMDGKEHNKCSNGTSRGVNCTQEFLDTLKKMGQDKTLNHQTNFGLLQMSPDRFALHPMDSIKAMERVLCPQSKVNFDDVVGLKGAAYFKAARAKLPQLKECLKKMPANEFLRKCGLPNAAAGVTIAGYGAAAKKMPIVGRLVPDRVPEAAERVSRIQQSILDKWDGMDAGYDKWASSIYSNPHASGNNQVNEVLGTMMSLCPTLNVGLAMNELVGIDWVPDSANPQGKALKPGKVTSRVIPYFDSNTQKLKPVCLDQVRQAANMKAPQALADKPKPEEKAAEGGAPAPTPPANPVAGGAPQNPAPEGGQPAPTPALEATGYGPDLARAGTPAPEEESETAPDTANAGVGDQVVTGGGNAPAPSGDAAPGPAPAPDNVVREPAAPAPLPMVTTSKPDMSGGFTSGASDWSTSVNPTELGALTMEGLLNQQGAGTPIPEAYLQAMGGPLNAQALANLDQNTPSILGGDRNLLRVQVPATNPKPAGTNRAPATVTPAQKSINEERVKLEEVVFTVDPTTKTKTRNVPKFQEEIRSITGRNAVDYTSPGEIVANIARIEALLQVAPEVTQNNPGLVAQWNGQRFELQKKKEALQRRLKELQNQR